jgi:hypothetical protein
MADLWEAGSDGFRAAVDAALGEGGDRLFLAAAAVLDKRGGGGPRMAFMADVMRVASSVAAGGGRTASLFAVPMVLMRAGRLPDLAPLAAALGGDRLPPGVEVSLDAELRYAVSVATLPPSKVRALAAALAAGGASRVGVASACAEGDEPDVRLAPMFVVATGVIVGDGPPPDGWARATLESLEGGVMPEVAAISSPVPIAEISETLEEMIDSLRGRIRSADPEAAEPAPVRAGGVADIAAAVRDMLAARRTAFVRVVEGDRATVTVEDGFSVLAAWSLGVGMSAAAADLLGIAGRDRLLCGVARGQCLH